MGKLACPPPNLYTAGHRIVAILYTTDMMGGCYVTSGMHDIRHHIPLRWLSRFTSLKVAKHAPCVEKHHLSLPHLFVISAYLGSDLYRPSAASHCCLRIAVFACDSGTGSCLLMFRQCPVSTPGHRLGDGRRRRPHGAVAQRPAV